MRLLLISNSASPGESYLERSVLDLATLLEGYSDEIVFIPYAAVSYGYDEYVDKVNAALVSYKLSVRGIHTYPDPVRAIEGASAILIGGGNTFQLLKSMQANRLIQPIRSKVRAGTPYAGWSAGSNVACPTIRTTNDMPIVEPSSLDALGLIPFQINPHYLDAHPSNHGGETREQRIQEYLVLNPNSYVVGLREGCRLLVENSHIELKGDKTMRLFHHGEKTQEISPDQNIDFLL